MRFLGLAVSDESPRASRVVGLMLALWLFVKEELVYPRFITRRCYHRAGQLQVQHLNRIE